MCASVGMYASCSSHTPHATRRTSQPVRETAARNQPACFARTAPTKLFYDDLRLYAPTHYIHKIIYIFIKAHGGHKPPAPAPPPPLLAPGLATRLEPRPRRSMLQRGATAPECCSKDPPGRLVGAQPHTPQVRPAPGAFGWLKYPDHLAARTSSARRPASTSQP
jgi:hypothetical protein